MASSYQIADGYNNAAGYASLDVDGKPPRCQAIGLGRLRTNGVGVVREDGFRSASIVYGYLTPSEYETLVFTTMGFSATEVSNQVTIALPDRDARAFVNYNAIIRIPDNLNYTLGFYLQVSFNITRMDAI